MKKSTLQPFWCAPASPEPCPKALGGGPEPQIGPARLNEPLSFRSSSVFPQVRGTWRLGIWILGVVLAPDRPIYIMDTTRLDKEATSDSVQESNSKLPLTRATFRAMIRSFRAINEGVLTSLHVPSVPLPLSFHYAGKAYAQNKQ